MNQRKMMPYKKLSFPSVRLLVRVTLGVNLKSVTPTESEATFTKVMGAISTALLRSEMNDTTMKTVNIPI